MWSKIFTTVKYALVSVNFIFLITGVIVLAVGSSVQKTYNGYHDFLSDRFFSLPAFCIATGIIIFLIATLGFYGAFKENYMLIMAFAGSMVVMFIFQLSACIAGYALKDNTVALVQKQLYTTMEMYGTDDFVVTKLWDEVQSDFQCCGVKNASDWLVPLNSTSSQGLPMSCCSFPYGQVQTFNCTLNQSTLYKDNCSDSFGSFIQSHAAAIGVAGIFLVLIQALVVVGALWMAKISREENGAYP